MICKPNTPALWLSKFPKLEEKGNKYTRGNTIIIGGPRESTGAAKLAALSALRIGSGLVSIACDDASLDIYSESLMSVMTKPVNNVEDLQELIKQDCAVLIGPGAGVNDRTTAYTKSILQKNKKCVIDADALTVFQDTPKVLFQNTSGNAVLTPHDGESQRLFELSEDRVQSALNAAKLSNAVIVLKGAKTIVTSPEGGCAINEESTPFLATAGSGDVLAGIIIGLMAQGVSPFDAACIGVWIHSQAAIKFGPGLISEDLPGMIPSVVSDIYKIYL